MSDRKTTWNCRGSTVRILKMRIDALKLRAQETQDELQVAEAALAGAQQAEQSLESVKVARHG